MAVAEEAKLYPCVPANWLWLPRPLRIAFGYLTMCLFAWTFFSPLFCLALLVPWVWKTFPRLALGSAILLVVSYLVPMKEWHAFRLMGQLWYELLQVQANLGPEDIPRRLDEAQKVQLILAMHPHGIVPFQAVLWSAYCHQYFQDPADPSRSLYGFGAAADIVQHVPLLRNVLAWLTAGGAAYRTLRDGLVEGKCASANPRVPRHLYILPGGIAEIFVSTPGRHAMVFSNRKGLVRLSLETGARLVPCYVFGGTDFFHNLATSQSPLARLSRAVRAGVTVFFGHLGLPLPFTPRVTLVLGDPIPLPAAQPGDDEKRSKAVDVLHAEFIAQMTQLFDKYKAAAGYPEATLEVL